MATLREVRKRIRGVKSTRRITRAMEMVAAAKLRKAQARVEQAKPYAAKLDEMLSHLAAASTGEIQHPFFEQRPVEKSTLVLVTADRGLCGSFNANLMREAEAWRREHADEPFEFMLFGKKGWDYYRRRDVDVLDHQLGWEGEMDYGRARDAVQMLTDRFVSGKTDRIDLIYTTFVSMGSFRVTRETFLPIPRHPTGSEDEDQERERDYIFEPDPQAIYEQLLPYYATTKMITVLTESFASEQASRMLAMNAATKAAGDMIDALTLDFNKARQAQITKELSEVVSGADALKG
ncbi:ATP synthase F1 subunit gamma [candidate division GN15 bacterium]|nr:ATP synthase F1 subunit gamma [candidate division GN15 bacterium]